MRSVEQDVSAASVVLILIAVLVFVSPFAEWWIRRTPPWWLIYLLWLLLAIPAAWLSRWMSRYEP